MTAQTQTWLVIGLGNPGEVYENTRHNLGWWAIERLMQDKELQNVVAQKVSLRSRLTGNFFESVHTADYANKNIVLMKPRTFVNATGRAVRKLLTDYNAEPSNIITICDDMNLDVGRIRVKSGGGSGNHNGLQSIINALGTEQFARVRIGIGQPRGGARNWQDYVLKRIPKQEQDTLQLAAKTASNATKAIITEGIEQAMNRYN